MPLKFCLTVCSDFLPEITTKWLTKWVRVDVFLLVTIIMLIFLRFLQFIFLVFVNFQLVPFVYDWFSLEWCEEGKIPLQFYIVNSEGALHVVDTCTQPLPLGVEDAQFGLFFYFEIFIVYYLSLTVRVRFFISVNMHSIEFLLQDLGNWFSEIPYCQP